MDNSILACFLNWWISFCDSSQRDRDSGDIVAILGLGTFMVAKVWVHPLDILRLQAWRIFSWPPDVKVLVNGKNVSFNNWGESGFVGSIVSFTLVRDETREIALSHRSKEWTTFALPVLDRFAPPDCNSSIKNLSDVYYVVTTAC